jgi:single-stranded-DNA-specific exonuclease
LAEDWLDLVALGTVADVVPLRGENRKLVRRGLNLMRSQVMQGRPGLYSLASVAGLKIPRLTAGDIAFGLGPRLNAAGRLDTAMDALRLLMAENLSDAGLLSQNLDNQNRERQEMTRKIQEESIQLAQELGSEDILFAFHTNFSSGVVGLAASRLVESFYRPAVVGEKGPEVTRASCRSIPEFHITRALDECKDLLVRHGGHALAAGFTVKNENLPALVERLRGIAARDLTNKDLRPSLRADMEISLHELHPNFLKYLDYLQPTGQDNAEAVFVSRNLRVKNHRAIGKEGAHLRLTVTDGRITYDAIAFRHGHRAENMPSHIDMMYAFEQNEYNGRVSLQLNVRDFKPAGMPD